MRYAFSSDEVDQRQQPFSRPLLVEAEEGIHGAIRLPFRWLSDPPGGWYGADYCPSKAGRMLTTDDVHLWDDRNLSHMGRGPWRGRGSRFEHED